MADEFEALCCKDLARLSGSKSPFSKMIVLGFYDGPTSGIVQCEGCRAVYKFRMIDWDHCGEVRVFSLEPLPPSSLDKAVGILGPYEQAHWPIWVPKWQFPSEEVKSGVDSAISEILDSSGPPKIVVAWTRYGESISAAREVHQPDINDIQDWFFPETPKSNRDWFSYLGLAR